MSDDLPGTCCMCGGSSGIVYARAVDNNEIEAICRNCYPDKSPPQIARLIQENSKLRDLLRWRDAWGEPPTEHGEYLVQQHEFYGGAELMVLHWNGKWPLQRSMVISHWRPIGPLPEGE